MLIANELWILWRESAAYAFLNSYFEEGCRKKCTRQSRKVLWVVLSSLFVEEIWKNGPRRHGRMFAYVCECESRATKVGLTATVVRNSVLIISHISLSHAHLCVNSDDMSGKIKLFRKIPSFNSKIIMKNKKEQFSWRNFIWAISM